MIYNINKFSNLKFKFRLDEQKLYINRENPNQKKNKNYKFVSLNNEIIIMDNKTYSLDDFFKNIYNKYTKYVCLTFNEAFFISKKNFIEFNKLFPFVSTSEFNLLEINEKYKQLIFFKENLFDVFFRTNFKSIQDQYSSYLRFKQNKKIHYKNILDHNFFFAIKSGFSDVFKLLENRPDRKIYQLDVNSMHPFAMTKENYSIPSQLKYYKNNNIENILSDKITNGIFNCVLKIKNNLTPKARNFVRYIPINLIEDNTSIPINITKNDTINILLHANEIKFYSKYFDITLEDGVYSKKSISHPLKKWILDTYDKRLQSSGIQKDFYKFILVLSHSIILKRGLEEDFFSKNSIHYDFMQKYQYKLSENLNIANSYINLYEYDEEIIASKSYNINNNYNVYSLYSQVLANTRIHLLELYEKLHNSSKEFELCYCNIDSLHISIPIDKESLFKEAIKDLISPTELGKLKIESITNRGIWFEPGRYWLFNDNQLVNFKNTIFNDDNKDYKCVFKKIEYLDKRNDYKVNYFSLFKVLQNKKLIKEVDENHYVYYKNNNGGVSLLLNKINNLKKYKKIFKKYILKT